MGMGQLQKNARTKIKANSQDIVYSHLKDKKDNDYITKLGFQMKLTVSPEQKAQISHKIASLKARMTKRKKKKSRLPDLIKDTINPIKNFGKKIRKSLIGKRKK